MAKKQKKHDEDPALGREPETFPEPEADHEPEAVEEVDPDWCPRCKAPALKGKPGVKFNCSRCRDKN